MNDVLFASIASLCALVTALVALYVAARPFRDRRYLSLRSASDSLRADYDELLLLVKRMDARDKMRQVRMGRSESESPPSTRSKANGRPDPMTHPNEWKAYMRETQPLVGPAKHRE